MARRIQERTQESSEDGTKRVVTGACGSAGKASGSERARAKVFPIGRKQRGGKNRGAEESVAGAN